MEYPLVSIVIPVYNGAEFLSECLDSILAQTYRNWDCTILDNCSSDGSGDIANQYARRDSRIRVVTNEHFLRVNANHNAAFRLISPDSKYCKPVFADDWIFPRCLEEMVALAEANPNVAIVGALALQGCDVMWSGLPYPSTAVSGREVCRRLFLADLYVFGTANSLLFRSDVIRTGNPFFNESNLHADMEACIITLKTYDFGFVHQVLTFKRTRPDSLTSFSEEINTLIAGHLHNLVAHGRDFLTPEEFTSTLKRKIAHYYNFLAVSLMRGRRDAQFWDYHKSKLNAAGIGFSRTRLARAVFSRICRGILNPLESATKARAAFTTSRTVTVAENNNQPTVPLTPAERDLSLINSHALVEDCGDAKKVEPHSA